MRNRQKQRERKNQREESLDIRNTSGYRDLTAFLAVARIRGEAKLTGVNKDGSIKA